MRKREITTQNAPKAIGPYAQAIACGGFIFCSGQIARNPEKNEMVNGGIREQTAQVLKNIEAVLHAAGADLTDVVKTTVYLADMNDFPQMNEVYATFFKNPYPARATIEGGKLPNDARVEIDCIAREKKEAAPCCKGNCCEEKNRADL